MLSFYASGLRPEVGPSVSRSTRLALCYLFIAGFLLVSSCAIHSAASSVGKREGNEAIAEALPELLYDLLRSAGASVLRSNGCVMRDELSAGVFLDYRESSGPQFADLATPAKVIGRRRGCFYHAGTAPSGASAGWRPGECGFRGDLPTAPTPLLLVAGTVVRHGSRYRVELNDYYAPWCVARDAVVGANVWAVVGSKEHGGFVLESGCLYSETVALLRKASVDGAVSTRCVFGPGLGQ